MKSTAVVLGIFLAIFAIITDGEAVRCYNCIGATGTDPQSCVTGAALTESLVTEPCEACVYQHYKVDSTQYMERACSPVTPETTGCEPKTFLEANHEGTICTCTSNLCNDKSGATKPIPILPILLTLSGLMITLQALVL